jgi:hypothetical protein
MLAAGGEEDIRELVPNFREDLYRATQWIRTKEGVERMGLL